MTTMPQLDAESVDDSRWHDGTWMQTIGGRRVSIVHPHPEDLDVEDIAHALSMQCRYNGHVKKFYSVAEHSVLVARLLEDAGYSPDVQFVGLLHDAPEAYVGDLIRPVKVLCGDYHKVEERMWVRAFVPRFDLPAVMPDAVKWADNLALFMERRDLLAAPPAEWVGEHELASQVRPWATHALPPTRAKEDFLDWFARLNAARA